MKDRIEDTDFKEDDNDLDLKDPRETKGDEEVRRSSFELMLKHIPWIAGLLLTLSTCAYFSPQQFDNPIEASRTRSRDGFYPDLMVQDIIIGETLLSINIGPCDLPDNLQDHQDYTYFPFSPVIYNNQGNALAIEGLNVIYSLGERAKIFPIFDENGASVHIAYYEPGLEGYRYLGGAQFEQAHYSGTFIPQFDPSMVLQKATWNDDLTSCSLLLEDVESIGNLQINTNSLNVGEFIYGDEGLNFIPEDNIVWPE